MFQNESFSLNDFNNKYQPDGQERQTKTEAAEGNDGIKPLETAAKLLKLKKEILALEGEIYNADQAPAGEYKLKESLQKLRNAYSDAIGEIFNSIHGAERTGEFLEKIDREMGALQNQLREAESSSGNEDMPSIMVRSDWAETSVNPIVLEEQVEALKLLDSEVRYHKKS